MNSRNCENPADSKKIFKISSLAIVHTLACYACFLPEASALEAATAREGHKFGRENSVSRIKTLEMHLKLLERRLQAVEGKAPLNKEGNQAFEERTCLSPPGDESSLKDLEQQMEALEKRLEVVENAPSSNEAKPPKDSLARHQDGFYLYTDEDAGFQMRLGGGLQVDYRYYGEEDRTDDRFDIRRARLNLSGRLFHLLGYRTSYEFQGSESKNLLDAYGEIGVYGPNVFRFGQFKVPFSLEQQTSYKDLFFAERSMGYYLEPRRDVGLGLRSHFFQDAVNYAVGVFNGDDTNGSSWGSQQDDPELAGRFVIAPFKTMSLPWLARNHFWQ